MAGRSERLSTRVVRTARALPAGAGVPVVPPLVHSVAFDHASAAEQDAVFGGDRPGYVYGRYGTPTTAALEGALAELEGADAAVAFVSGMSAIHAYLTGCALPDGGRVVAQEDLYGAVRAVLERLGREQGADITFVDPTDHASVRRALDAAPTRVLYVEAVANPLLRVTDVAALAELAHDRGAVLAVDATFASPVLLRPLELGADVVIHSLTKYLNGHGDAMGGVVAGSTDVAREMRDRAILDGAYLPPHEAWLILRGLRTVALRVRRQSESALAVARHLESHPRIARVHYPGLASHPQHELASSAACTAARSRSCSPRARGTRPSASSTVSSWSPRRRRSATCTARSCTRPSRRTGASRWRSASVSASPTGSFASRWASRTRTT